MATIVTMPRLSDTMTEGTVAAWLKKVGDKVSEGDMLAEIETDKATMEFESFNEGTLLYIGIQAGETAPIDSLLAIIGNEGEDISALIAGGATAAPVAAAPAATEAQTRNCRSSTSCNCSSFTSRSYRGNNASFERHNDRRNCSYLVEKSRRQSCRR